MLGAMAVPGVARAQTARAPIPEPIFSETVTDIDGTEMGELEISADVGAIRALHGGGQIQVAGIEAEWLATHNLGLRVEPSIAWRRFSGDGSSTEGGVGTTASWKVVRDLRDDFYLQGEVSAEWPPRAEPLTLPDQPGLPFGVDVRAAFRRDVWTLRGSLGAGFGGSSPHVPLRGSVALLVGLEPSASTGFIGIEALADGTWVSPFFVAPDFVADLSTLGLPVRLGVALPLSPGASSTEPSYGVYLRLLVEPLRDLEKSSTAD
jgi:hypothetical protein